MEVHTETCQFMSRLYFQRYFSPFTVLLKSKLVRLLSALYWFAVGCACVGDGGISFRSHRKALPGEEVSQQWDLCTSVRKLALTDFRSIFSSTRTGG